MAFTDKKRRFVLALRSGMSGAKAAIHAGYSENGAKVAASRLMRDKDVLAALERGGVVNQEVNKPDAQSQPESAPADAYQVQDHVAAGEAVAELLSKFGQQAPVLTKDPMVVLTALMNDLNQDPKLRKDAATALLPYHHGKVAEQGKKDAQKDAAMKATGGKFGRPAPPPGLRVVGGGK